MKAIANLKLEAPAGTRFKYSDVGFIVLGELIHRISGKHVDVFAVERNFRPLAMTNTGYKPRPPSIDWTAPTGLRNKEIIRGEVHDPRAFAMGGVAGHAGLFSTADDMAKYCKMLLHDGELDGVRIMSKESVKRFTEPHDVPPKGQR